MKKFKIISIAVAIIAVVTILVSMKRCASQGIEIERNDKITPTPNIITEVRNMGKWEFLSVRIEELIDTTKGKFFKDQLSAIYSGTLRYGIDCNQAQDNWISQNGDSVCVFLPEVKLLDDYFLDEASTRIVFESGSFSSKDREDLRERAINRILAKSEMLGYKNTAQDNAKEQFTIFLQQLGIKNIVFMEQR